MNWKERLYNHRPQKKYSEDSAEVLKMKQMIAKREAEEALLKAASEQKLGSVEYVPPVGSEETKESI